MLRCADEILKRRAQGESLTDIHGDLQDRAEIDIRLRAFSLWVGRLEDGALLSAAPTGELTRVTNTREAEARRPASIRNPAKRSLLWVQFTPSTAGTQNSAPRRGHFACP